MRPGEVQPENGRQLREVAGGQGVNQFLETVELISHHLRGERGMRSGQGGVEGHEGLGVQVDGVALRARRKALREALFWKNGLRLWFGMARGAALRWSASLRARLGWTLQGVPAEKHARSGAF